MLVLAGDHMNTPEGGGRSVVAVTFELGDDAEPERLGLGHLDAALEKREDGPGGACCGRKAEASARREFEVEVDRFGATRHLVGDASDVVDPARCVIGAEWLV